MAAAAAVLLQTCTPALTLNWTGPLLAEPSTVVAPYGVQVRQVPPCADTGDVLLFVWRAEWSMQAAKTNTSQPFRCRDDCTCTQFAAWPVWFEGPLYVTADDGSAEKANATVVAQMVPAPPPVAVGADFSLSVLHWNTQPKTVVALTQDGCSTVLQAKTVTSGDPVGFTASGLNVSEYGICVGAEGGGLSLSLEAVVVGESIAAQSEGVARLTGGRYSVTAQPTSLFRLDSYTAAVFGNAQFDCLAGALTRAEHWVAEHRVTVSVCGVYPANTTLLPMWLGQRRLQSSIGLAFVGFVAVNGCGDQYGIDWSAAVPHCKKCPGPSFAPCLLHRCHSGVCDGCSNESEVRRLSATCDCPPTRGGSFCQHTRLPPPVLTPPAGYVGTGWFEVRVVSPVGRAVSVEVVSDGASTGYLSYEGPVNITNDRFHGSITISAYAHGDTTDTDSPAVKMQYTLPGSPSASPTNSPSVSASPTQAAVSAHPTAAPTGGPVPIPTTAPTATPSPRIEVHGSEVMTDTYGRAVYAGPVTVQMAYAGTFRYGVTIAAHAASGITPSASPSRVVDTGAANVSVGSIGVCEVTVAFAADVTVTSFSVVPQCNPGYCGENGRCEHRAPHGYPACECEAGWAGARCRAAVGSAAPAPHMAAFAAYALLHDYVAVPGAMVTVPFMNGGRWCVTPPEYVQGTTLQLLEETSLTLRGGGGDAVWREPSSCFARGTDCVTAAPGSAEDCFGLAAASPAAAAPASALRSAALAASTGSELRTTVEAMAAGEGVPAAAAAVARFLDAGLEESFGGSGSNGSVTAELQRSLRSLQTAADAAQLADQWREAQVRELQDRPLAVGRSLRAATYVLWLHVCAAAVRGADVHRALAEGAALADGVAAAAGEALLPLDEVADGRCARERVHAFRAALLAITRADAALVRDRPLACHPAALRFAPAEGALRQDDWLVRSSTGWRMPLATISGLPSASPPTPTPHAAVDMQWALADPWLQPTLRRAVDLSATVTATAHRPTTPPMPPACWLPPDSRRCVPCAAGEECDGTAVKGLCGAMPTGAGAAYSSPGSCEWGCTGSDGATWWRCVRPGPGWLQDASGVQRCEAPTPLVAEEVRWLDGCSFAPRFAAQLVAVDGGCGSVAAAVHVLPRSAVAADGAVRLLLSSVAETAEGPTVGLVLGVVGATSGVRLVLRRTAAAAPVTSAVFALPAGQWVRLAAVERAGAVLFLVDGSPISAAAVPAAARRACVSGRIGVGGVLRSDGLQLAAFDGLLSFAEAAVGSPDLSAARLSVRSSRRLQPCPAGQRWTAVGCALPGCQRHNGSCLQPPILAPAAGSVRSGAVVTATAGGVAVQCSCESADVRCSIAGNGQAAASVLLRSDGPAPVRCSVKCSAGGLSSTANVTVQPVLPVPTAEQVYPRADDLSRPLGRLPVAVHDYVPVDGGWRAASAEWAAAAPRLRAEMRTWVGRWTAWGPPTHVLPGSTIQVRVVLPAAEHGAVSSDPLQLVYPSLAELAAAGAADRRWEPSRPAAAAATTAPQLRSAAAVSAAVAAAVVVLSAATFAAEVRRRARRQMLSPPPDRALRQPPSHRATARPRPHACAACGTEATAGVCAPCGESLDIGL